MAITKTIEINVKNNSAQAQKDLNNLANSINQAGNSSTQLTEKLSGTGKASAVINSVGDAVGKLNPAFGSAIKGADGLLLKMYQLVANPIGAIIAALVVSLKFLYEAFQSSVAGGKEIKAVFAGITAVGIQVKDAIFGLGRALINTIDAAIKFIKLDFKGAAESMKKANTEVSNSYKQLGNAVDGTTAKIIYNLTKQQQAIDKARKIQAVVQSETNKLLVQSREILTDETASIRDKKKALDEVTKAEIASSKEKVRIAAEDLKIAKARAKALGGEEEKKAKGEIRDLTIALNEAETENAMTGIKLNKQRKMLNRQENEDAKAFAEEAKTRAKEASDKAKEAAKEKAQIAKDIYTKDLELLKENLANEKLTFDERRKLVLDNTKLTAEDRIKLNKQINLEEAKAIETHNKAIADLNKRYDDEKLNREANTAVKKEELDYQRKLKEINDLAKTELEKQNLVDKLNTEHNIRLTEAKKTDDLKAQEEVLKKLQLDKDYENLNFEEKRAAIKEKEALLLADKTLTEQQRNEILQKFSNDRVKIDVAEAEQKAAIQNSIIDVTTQGIGLIKGLFEKNKGVQKAAMLAESALGIAKIIVNTQTANAIAAASPLNAVDPSYGIRARIINTVGAGIGIASNIAATAKALASLGGGGAPSGGNVGGAAGGGAAPAPQFNVVGNSGVNQIASTLGNQQPIQAFVVANQVTSQQSLDRNIVNNASIG